MELLILLILILLNAFFAASEIALISLNDNKIRVLAEAGDKKAQQLQKLLQEPSRFLATIQIGITFAGFLASAFAAESFADQLVDLLLNLGVKVAPAVLKPAAVIVITISLAYFTLVLGELVPKRMAMQKPEPLARLAVGPLAILAYITSPFVKLLTLSTNFIIRALGGDPNANEENVTEEEIRMMVDVGEERGTIHESEKELINNIFDFDDKIVTDIMTPRVDIVGVSIKLPLDEIVNLISREKFTRVPVYQDSIDNIVGILHLKDLIKYINKRGDSGFDLRTIMWKPLFVPESKKANELFRDLQLNKTHMAVVIDEYGGTTGIVTVEDLLEEIVGSILDEHDEDEREFERLDETTFMFAGGIDLDKVQKIIDVKLPTDEYETLSGFLIGQLGKIPLNGDQPTIEFDEVVFKVEEVHERRITRVKACRVLS